jgi:hypothetical protein
MNSLASRIVLASFYPDSRYNVLTGQVFRRFKPNTHGQAAFWQWIADTASRMVKARHSSTGFFKTCAGVVKQIFRGAVYKSSDARFADFGDGLQALPGGGNVTKSIGRLAGGMVARETDLDARATFWVTATEPDTKGRQGAGLFGVAQPVWQRALDDEAAALRDYAESLYVESARKSGLVLK